LQELYVQAAQCAVEAIGLDGAIVLRRRDGEWEIAASHLPHPELGIHCDLAVLDQLLAAPETLFHGSKSQEPRVESQENDNCGTCPDAGAHSSLPSRSESTRDFTEPAVVVSPLKNGAGQLVGAIYGYRSIRAGNGRRGIRYLEANLIELLARAVCEGAERLNREADVDQRRALAEQALFATLDHDPQRLAGERREVTLLFADLRGFSELSAPLTHETVYELLGQVMDCLTAAVMDHDGMVIDYYGDGLAAMWNAPAEQADHAELACRAAMRMLESLPDVAADWATVLDQHELRLGIGVHTGEVQIGNAGSRRRMKYGPRGANVHVASRVEAATKKLGLPFVISGASAERLSVRFKTYRVCRAQLPGIDAPVDLHGIKPTRTTMACELAIDEYSDALRLFEKGELEQAAAILATIDPQTVVPPARFLAEHIERELGRNKRRRSSDGLPPTSRGIISINVK
jgi:adenylate cyclase